jgi:outer membrane protein
MNRLLLLASFVHCLAIFSPVSAQPANELSLHSSITLALKQGYATGNAASDYQSSKKSYQAALRRLRTTVDLTLSLPNFQESLTNQFKSSTQAYQFYQTQTMQMQASLNITQPLVFTGGTVTFRDYVFRRDQTSGLSGSQQTTRDYFSNFAVEFRQPFFTANQLGISHEKALLGLQQAQTTYVRDQLNIIYNVTNEYYVVYQLQRRVAIVQEQVDQNKDSYNTAQSKYEAGLIAEVEALKSEVDLVTSQNDLLNAQRDLAREKNMLRLMLGMPLSGDIEVRDSLIYQPVALDTAKAIQSALAHRSEITIGEMNKRLREIDIDLANAKRDFRFDLTASYGLNRNNTDPARVFQDFGATRNAALTISIPVFDWGTNSLEVEAARIQYQNAVATQDYTEQQIRQEVFDLISRFHVAESRINVLRKVVSVAQRGYDINLERFKSGTINQDELAQSQQRLTSAKLNDLAALVDYKLALEDLKRKTLWDFEKNEAVTVVEESEE